jgi:hypothetical protein
MKRTTAYRLRGEKKLLCQNQTAVLNSQVILNYLERVDKSLQSSRVHFSMDGNVRREERVGKALKPKSYK